MMTILNHCNVSPEGKILDSMYSIFRTGVQLIEAETENSKKSALIDELITLVGFIDFDATREECFQEMFERGYITSLKNMTCAIVDDDSEEQ